MISKEHSIPRQPLRVNNGLAPRFEPIHDPSSRQTRSRLSDRKTSKEESNKDALPAHGQKKLSTVISDSQEGASVVQGAKSNIINVEVVFANQAKVPLDPAQSSRQHSRRDWNILTLRNSEDRSGR